ncbi:adaptor protein MecA [Limosilactobacillus sp. STM2_1]|uniref:Adapter protein MecA n=2 Tax=Limosilactobacillus TaxID=2742598 RepID=A0A7W3UJE3_9LACO|nr:adaptor protein MecA [Limosilactobacillus rudii]MBB1078523.1 adaptor protein MecA [Limosilactobacillus rudii]MBB1096652.1 adaptor protein MecA [Limosilactobacillus rudii]MCD7133685.1 adaptor protein MecA [Limosilactobacillus rudii]
MEMERINENTIRVLVDNDDLSARGITILDLLGDHQQIEDFFYSILKEVDTDHQFQNNDAVTFQVMPTNNGLELFISKNDSNLAGNEQHGPGNDQVSQFIKQHLIQKRTKNQEQRNTTIDNESSDVKVQRTKWQVVVFSSFEDLIDFAKIAEDNDVSSYLYKYDNRYYLALAYSDTNFSGTTVKDQLAIAYEYGNPTATTVDFLSEHGKKIMSVSALHLIRHYFD